MFSHACVQRFFPLYEGGGPPKQGGPPDFEEDFQAVVGSRGEGGGGLWVDI